MLQCAFVISYHEEFKDQSGSFKLVAKEVNPKDSFDEQAPENSSPEQGISDYEDVNRTFSVIKTPHENTNAMVVLSGEQECVKQTDALVPLSRGPLIVITPPFKRYSPTKNPCDCSEFLRQLENQEKGMNKLEGIQMQLGLSRMQETKK